MDPRTPATTDLATADDAAMACPSSAPACGSANVRRSAQALVAVFLAIAAGGSVSQTLVELIRGEPVGVLQVFRQKPTAANLRAYEHGLEDASVIARTVRPWFQFIQFAWLRDGGEKALVGRDGWLFYKPGCDDLLARTSPHGRALPDPAAEIVAWRDALAARGIQLLVVPVPNKESIYPDRLTRRAPPAPGKLSPVSRNLFAQLQNAGVEAVDLFALFAEARAGASGADATPLYLTQDSHWSPAGLRLAARAVAQRLVERGWIQPGDRAFEERPAPVRRLGDVVQMFQSRSIERQLDPEKVNCTQVVDAHSGHPYRDEPDAEVLILGDSFLRIYDGDEPGSAGFAAHLARELRKPVARLVADGGASTLVRQELHRRPGLLAQKRVVVWEFVERDLRLGTEGWQPVPLPPSESTNRPGAAPSATSR